MTSSLTMCAPGRSLKRCGAGCSTATNCRKPPKNSTNGLNGTASTSPTNRRLADRKGMTLEAVTRKYMAKRAEIFLMTGAAIVTGGMLLALIPNPLVPDVCASRGYGYPLPVYISGCDCFEDPRQPVNLAYVGIDIVVWGSLWLAISAVLAKISKASTVPSMANEFPR